MSGASMGDEKWLNRMLLLLPGFFSLAIARYLTSGPELDEFSLVSYSLAFSLFNYVLAVLLYRLFSSIKRRLGRGRQGETSLGPEYSLPFMVWVLILSIVLGMITGYVYSTDVMLASLRHGPFAKVLTKRSVARPLSFLLAANRLGTLEEGRPGSMKQGQAWLNIYMKEGKIFAGYPEFFPMSDEESEIFLSPACSVDNKGKAKQWPGPGVLIPEEEIHYIAFIDRDQSECHNIWKGISEETEETAAANTSLHRTHTALSRGAHR